MKFTLRFTLFFILGLGLFYPSLHGEFIMDDWGYITQNPMIRDSSSPLVFWTHLASVDYWPLSYTVYWGLYRVFGENALAYHLLNIALHSANTALLWTLALHFPATAGVAAFVSTLFFVHPLHVQAVSWMIQSKTLLATFFFLLSWILLKGKRWPASIITYALSLFAKTSTVTAPFVFLGDTRSWKKSAPFFLLALGLGAITVYVNELHFTERSADVFHLAWYDRPALMLQNLMFYLSTFLFPGPLAYMYPFAPPALLSARFLILLLAAVAVGFWLLGAKNLTAGRPFLIGYLILLFPTLGAVPIPNMKLSLVADHWAYLPDTLLTLAIGAWIAPYWRRPVTRLAAGAVLIVFAALTYRHAATFATEQAFWEQALSVNPLSSVPYYNLGTVFGKKEDHQNAILAYQKAVTLDPTHARAWYNKGRSHFLRGEVGDAKESFLEALKHDPKIDKVYTALATLHLKFMDKKAASEILEKGLAQNPDSREIRRMLSEINGLN